MSGINLFAANFNVYNSKSDRSSVNSLAASINGLYNPNVISGSGSDLK